MTKKIHLLTVPAAFTMLVGLLAPANATTIISGDLFFTTFQNGVTKSNSLPAPTNVWKVSFVYDSVTGLSLGAVSPIVGLLGADGLMFDPNDPTHKTILIGEQEANLVAQLGTNGTVINEKLADKSKPAGYTNAQAYGVASPDNAHLITLPNDPTYGVDHINISPLGLNTLGDGTLHQVSGVSSFLRGMDFRKGVAYWGDAPDGLSGKFGIIGDLTSTFVTSLVTIVDDLGGGAGQGALPSHGITYDLFSDCFFLSSGNQIWQLCPDAKVANTFHIKAKVTAGASPAGAGGTIHNWDQTSVDGLGHLFAANNDGNLLFIDYNATGNIGTATYTSPLTFLAADLDDIINGGGAPPPPLNADGRMTGGGSVFTSDGTRVTHGFELHCDVADVPNNLEINWNGGNNFHLETLTKAFCFTDPKIDSGHPKAPFNTYVGTGTGKLNGVPGATATWTFTDAGEPGVNDTASIVIKDAGGNIVLTVSGNLNHGNQQAHTDNK